MWETDIATRGLVFRPARALRACSSGQCASSCARALVSSGRCAGPRTRDLAQGHGAQGPGPRALARPWARALARPLAKGLGPFSSSSHARRRGSSHGPSQGRVPAPPRPLRRAGPRNWAVSPGPFEMAFDGGPLTLPSARPLYCGPARMAPLCEPWQGHYGPWQGRLREQRPSQRALRRPVSTGPCKGLRRSLARTPPPSTVQDETAAHSRRLRAAVSYGRSADPARPSDAPVDRRAQAVGAPSTRPPPPAPAR